MKVKCALCGTKFDLERNNSICPNCAYHHHVDGESQRSFEGYTNNYSVHTGSEYKASYSGDSFAKQQMRQEKLEDFVEDMKYYYEKNTQATSYDMHKEIKAATKQANYKNTYSNMAGTQNVSALMSTYKKNNSLYNQQNNKNTSKKSGKLLIGMILTAVIMGVAIFIIALSFIENKSVKEESVVNEYEFIEDTPTYGSINKNIGFDCGIFEIEEMEIVSDEVWNALEGHELVSMKYSFQPRGIYSSDAATYIDVFIVTHSGYYIEPVNTYVLEDDSSIDIYEEVDGQYTVCNDIYYEQGVMYYAVKKGDVASIYIKEYDENGKIIETYNITNVEEFIVEE